MIHETLLWSKTALLLAFSFKMNKTICNKRVKRLSLVFAKSVTCDQAFFFLVKFEWKRKREHVIAGYKIRNNVIRPPPQPSLVYE